MVLILLGYFFNNSLKHFNSIELTLVLTVALIVVVRDGLTEFLQI